MSLIHSCLFLCLHIVDRYGLAIEPEEGRQLALPGLYYLSVGNQLILQEFAIDLIKMLDLPTSPSTLKLRMGL
jgi:hypothetical protein